MESFKMRVLALWTRRTLVRLCIGAMALPVVLSLTVIPPPVHSTSPPQMALVLLFDAGFVGLLAMGLAALARGR